MMARRPNPISAWLRSIHYHSARRESTQWSRLMDGALFVSPLLGVVAALLLDMSYRRTADDHVASGRIEFTPTTGRVVVLPDSDRLSTIPWGPQPIGRFRQFRESAVRGWPLPSSVVRSPPTTLVDIFAEQTVGERIAREDERAIIEAIDLAIIQGGDDTADALVLLADAPQRRLWWALAANAALCWILAYLVMGAVIQLARLVAWRIELRRRRRHRLAKWQSRCPQCGYDTRANVWSERCPECGALLD